MEPKAPGDRVYSIIRLPRLGLPILDTLAKIRGIDVRIVIEEVASVDFEEVLGADLLCISTVTSTAPGAYRLADRARATGDGLIVACSR